MHNRPLRLSWPFLFLLLASMVHPATAQTGSAARTSRYDAMLARAANLYSSTEREGIDAFDCNVHPEWRTLFLSANNGALDATDERKIAALNQVKVVLHARLKGETSVDWDPSASSGKREFADLMSSMKDSAGQTLQGFMQFWTPFANGSLLPATSEGYVVSPLAGGGFKMQSHDPEASVTEVFDANLTLRNFDVQMTDSTALFEPTFSPSPQGLRVTYIVSHMRQAGSTQEQEMNASIVYGTTAGYTLPVRLNMDIVGTGNFNFILDGCRVNP